MRIISGKFKGRRLHSFEAPHIRPTTDRVKESLFNILQGTWESATVLDLFAGTGNLSLEAISRGAARVTAVENHPKSLEIIRKNQELLGVAPSEMKILRMDVFDFLKKSKNETFDIILVDPPFTESLGHSVLEALACSSVVGPGTVVALESQKRERVDDEYETLARIDTRNFGDKLLSLFHRKADL